MKNGENKTLMTKVFRLFGVEILTRDLGWYLTYKVISRVALAGLPATRKTLIKEVALRSTDLLDCMNIPKHALYAPIAADYVKYNASPNYGEVVGARM